MNNKFVRLWVVLIVAGLFGSVATAKDPNKSKTDAQERLSKTAGDPRYAVLNVNNLTTWHRSDGHANHSPQADNGLYYPRGTGNVIYQDGVVFGGKAFVGGFEGTGTPAPNGQTVRIGGATYGVGTRAGYVTGSGATAVAANPNNPEVRIYRIRRDYLEMSANELRNDAGSVNEIPAAEVNDAQTAAVLAQYALDWDNWPVQYGAPYIERNGVAGYQEPPAFNYDASAGALFTLDSLISGNYDEPGVSGPDVTSPAAQVLWTVYNDLNEAQALGLFSSLPLGIEVQKTIWGYKRTDAMGNLYFSRYRLINKGGVDVDPATGVQLGSFYIDSMYVCQWSDPDLGSFSDDLAGSDSARSLGFIYNGNAQDATFRGYSLAPPSGGYDFLAGPTVTAAPGDSAVVDLRKVFGKRNLGMSSFAYFSAGSPYSDPPNGLPGGYTNTSGQWWKMLRGYAPLGGMASIDQPYAHPPGAPITQFPLSGLTIGGTASNSNFLDGQGQPYSFAPGDRRILLNTGPFQMAPGDTQEIYVGVVVGIGSDRTSSTAIMKANDNAVQITFDLLFQVSSPPAAPIVSVSELDGKVILEWSSNGARVADTEGRISQPGTYTFEGYNVYQLPSRGAQLSEATRIATYDLTTEPRVIFDTQFDPVSGQFIQIPVQFGSNSGVRRDFVFDRDYVRDIDKIYNGQEYYLAITAYSQAVDAGFTAALESAPNVITVRPKVPFGTVLNSAYGDTVGVTRLAGSSDGSAVALVVSPTQVTGATYTIGFKADQTWYLINNATGDTVINNNSDQSGSTTSPIAEGIQVRVSGAPNDAKDFRHPQGPSGAISPATYTGWSTFNGWGFPDPSGQGNPVADWGGGTWGVNQGGSATGAYSTFVSRVFRNDNFTRFVPYDFEIRFTAAGGLGYMAFTSGTIVNVPFELWNIGINTPTNPADDFRMIPWINDENGDDLFGIMAIDHALSGGTNDPYTDWIYWRNPNPATPGTAGYDAFVADAANYDAGGAVTGTGAEVMARLVLVNLNAGLVGDPGFPTNLTSAMPATGNVIRIISTKPNATTDQFSINTSAYAATTSSAALDQASVERAGVFPNPYYAFNAAETNRFARFVTFNNLPPKATIRIFNLAGQLVRRLDKDDTSQFLRWDLANQANFPVASGIYVAHLEMTLPTDNSMVTKVLKVAIIQEQEILNSY
jgi:hypothetical protein